MKRIGSLILLLTCLTSFVFANGTQQGKPARRMMGLKIAYVTKHLNLSSEEAEKFWPVYNSYIADLKKVRQEQKEDVLVFEENALNVRKKYRTDFKKVLNTDARANQALTLERDFNNMIRKELQKRRESKN